MQFAIWFGLWLAFACTGICQFVPYAGPTFVYPDTDVKFALLAFADYHNNYDLLAAPTNAQITTTAAGELAIGQWSGIISWHTPSRSAIGSTNLFVVRATSGDVPPLTATCMVNFVVIVVPPIGSINLSNKIPVLSFTNPIPIYGYGFIIPQGYAIQRTDMLPTTNWSLLAKVSSASPSITVTDTNPPAQQCFYRLVPDGGWLYDPFSLPP